MTVFGVGCIPNFFPSSSFSFFELRSFYFLGSFWRNLQCNAEFDLDREVVTVDGAAGAATVKDGSSVCLGCYKVV